MVLWRTFGPKRNEMTGGWRKLHNEEQVKEDEMGRACSRNGGRRRMPIGHWWESQKDRN
jgi:hypothetical protein